MIKTISENEARLLRKLLPKYYLYIQAHPYTLLSRIFGFHQLKIFKSKTEFTKIYLVTIVNIFRSGLDIDFRYDIKGIHSLRFQDPFMEDKHKKVKTKMFKTIQ